MQKCLFLFDSVHDVIKSEKIIKMNNFDYQIVPVPSHLSAECGMCIEIDNERAGEMALLLNSISIKFKMSEI